MEIKTINDLTAAYPDIVAKVREEAIAESKDAAVKEGIEQERERIKAIDEMAGKVSDDLLNKAKYETFDTAETVALNAIKEGAFVQTSVLDAMAQEAQAANGVEGVPNDGNLEPAVDKQKEATNHAEEVARNYFSGGEQK